MLVSLLHFRMHQRHMCTWTRGTRLQIWGCKSIFRSILLVYRLCLLLRMHILLSFKKEHNNNTHNNNSKPKQTKSKKIIIIKKTTENKREEVVGTFCGRCREADALLLLSSSSCSLPAIVSFLFDRLIRVKNGGKWKRC